MGLTVISYSSDTDIGTMALCNVEGLNKYTFHSKLQHVFDMHQHFTVGVKKYPALWPKATFSLLSSD